MDLNDWSVIKYSKDELLEIALSLGLNVNDQFEKYRLLDRIKEKVLSDGVPEGSHYLLEDLVKTLRLFDNSYTIELNNFELPTCFGYTSDLDTKCNKCILYQTCSQKLIDNLPDCFGILYDPLQCQQCIVKDWCQTKISQFSINPDLGFIYPLDEIPILSNILKALAQFRYCYHSWPVKVLMSKANRFFNIKIKNAEIKRQEHLVLDFWYMFKGEEQKVSEIIPLTLKDDRQPIETEGYYV